MRTLTTHKQTALSPRIGMCGSGLLAVMVLTVATTLPGCRSVQEWITDSDTEAQALVDQAKLAREQGDDELAESLLGQAIRVNPGNAEHHRDLAQLLLKRGDVEQAIEQLRLSVARDQDDPRSHFHLARVLFYQGEYEEADESLTQVLQLNPSHGEALMLKGALAERQGREEIALASYHKLLAEEPDNVEARLRVAGIHLRSERPENAAHILRSICQCPMASTEEKCDARWRLGQAYSYQSRWQSAAESMSAGLANVDGTSADDWYELANAWYRAGDREQAQVALSKALQRAPTHAGATALANRLATPPGSPNPASPIRYAEHQATKPGER